MDWSTARTVRSLVHLTTFDGGAKRRSRSFGERQAVEYDSSRNVGLAGLLNATRPSSVAGLTTVPLRTCAMATMSSAAWSLDAGEMFGRVIRSWR
jgi:hypothetical protein